MQNLNQLQLYALNAILCGYNVFLTGDAGTGKTYIIREAIKYISKNTERNIMILATTGLAALNIHGETVHSACGISPYTNTLGNIKIDDEKLSKFVYTDVIIIDEISMCRIDIFEIFVKYVLAANSIRRNKGKANIQIILVGDFFQLPPVVTDKDKEALVKKYGINFESGYAFQSPLWNTFNFKYIMLTEVVRQDNIDFIQSINKVKVGNKDIVKYINENSNRFTLDNAINIFGKNSEVTVKNNEELTKIESQLITAEATYTGEATPKDCNMEDILQIKAGARVMAVVNVNSDEYRYKCTNGEMGYITYIDLPNDVVHVKFDDGRTEYIERYKWPVCRYRIVGERLELEHVGDIEQYPIRLAYAITIHKSQGQTFERVNLQPYAWDCGQLYVALSRVTTLQGLHLVKEINPDTIKVSLNVIKFNNDIVTKANRALDFNINILDEQEKNTFDNEQNVLLNMLGNL